MDVVKPDQKSHQKVLLSTKYFSISLFYYVPHHTIKHLTITRVFYATFEGDIHQNWQIFDISKANPVKQEQK
jgi:hypothetical protein